MGAPIHIFTRTQPREMEDATKRRKLTPTNAYRYLEGKLIGYPMVRDLFFYQMDMSEALELLNIIHAKGGPDFLEKLKNDKLIWKAWFERDFREPLGDAVLDMPAWVAEKGVGARWMRYYTITRIGYRTLIFMVFDHVKYKLNPHTPLNVVPTLVGLDTVDVRLVPKPEYAELFRDEWQVERRERITLTEFFGKYARHRLKAMTTAFSGIPQMRKAQIGFVMVRYIWTKVDATLDKEYGNRADWSEWIAPNIVEAAIRPLLYVRSTPLKDELATAWFLWYVKLSRLLHVLHLSELDPEYTERLRDFGETGVYQEGVWQVGCALCGGAVTQQCVECGRQYCGEKCKRRLGRCKTGDKETWVCK